jgi:glutamate 5-kinase
MMFGPSRGETVGAGSAALGVPLRTSEVMTPQAVAAVPQGGGIRVHSIM